MEISDDFRSAVRELEQAAERQFPSRELTRIKGFFRILVGDEQPVYQPEQSPRLPNLFVPDLPSQPFVDTKSIDFIQQLEAAAGDIRKELETILPENGTLFSPYSSTPGWDAFFLIRG